MTTKKPECEVCVDPDCKSCVSSCYGCMGAAFNDCEECIKRKEKRQSENKNGD